jgi:ATP-dependent DNA ligase
MNYPAFVECKMDGEYTVIFYKRGVKCFTVNKYGKVREDYPALLELYVALEHSEADSCTMLAELYFKDGKLGRLYDLNSNKESDTLKLHVFDVAGINGQHVGKLPLVERKELLFELIGSLQCKTQMAYSKNDVENMFQETAFKFGYEGIVVKSLASTLTMGPCDWVKMKYKDRSDYEVRVVDPVLERIEVNVPHITGGMTNGTVNVGCKAPNRYKKHIKVGDMVTIEHQGVLDSGSLRHPVLIPRKEWK